MNKGNTHYDPEEEWFIRHLFHGGADDTEIAAALRRRSGRVLGAEAVRKIRRKLGLKKVPSYRRWEWVPQTWGIA